MTTNRVAAGIIAALSLAALSACAPVAPRSTTAQQNLNSAAVQATNAALSDQAEARATDDAQSLIADQSRRATEQAGSATEQAYTRATSATEQAARATEQARNAAAAQLMLEQQQIAATATRQALDRQMSLEIAAATKQAGEIRATATVIAKLQSTDDDIRARQRQDADFTFWLGWLIKAGIALAFLVGLFVIIEIVRKRGSVMMVGNMPVAVDGSFVGNVYVTSLIDPPQPKLLIAPPQEAVQSSNNGVHDVRLNGNPVESMGSQEFEDRQYWRTRTMRFLQTAMQVSAPGSNRIPRYDKMGVKAADWVDTTDALGQWIDKQERQPTFCLPPYETLEKLFNAIRTKEIVPLPQMLRAKYQQNSGKQETGKQRETGETGLKTAGNSPVPPLDDAASALPGTVR